jgi:ribulose-phosphate 3-epimerase
MTLPLTLTASILSIDPSRMQEEIASVEEHIDAIQLDIMDGRFVENVTYGPEVSQNLNTRLPLDVHLMVVDPENRIKGFIDVGARHVTFHAEAVPERADQERLVAAIRAAGCTAGIAINPTTPFDAVLTDVDMVLCMTVWPGKGGQAFIDDVLPKIRAIRTARPELSIQVDGGVNEETAKACIGAGADNLVIGSALFKAPDRVALLQRIRHAAS